MTIIFRNPEESHAHSLGVLNELYRHGAFMESVGSLIDLGCGSGLDLEWWATRTTLDDNPQPLNIKCIGVDRHENLPMAHRYKNISYIPGDFEKSLPLNNKRFDVVYCHDAFQYVINPFDTLRLWREFTNPNGMLVLTLPQTTNLEFNREAYDQPSGVYFNWTLVSLIHVLSVTGWDTVGGFFLKRPNDPWLHAIVYRGEHEPMDPKSTTWYDLAERNLLPQSAVAGVNRCGYLRQRDLVLPWLDKSLVAYRDY